MTRWRADDKAVRERTAEAKMLKRIVRYLSGTTEQRTHVKQGAVHRAIEYRIPGEVSAEVALRNPVFARCIELIPSLIGSLINYRTFYAVDRSNQRVTSGSPSQIVNRLIKGADGVSGRTLFANVVFDYLLYGNTFLWNSLRAQRGVITPFTGRAAFELPPQGGRRVVEIQPLIDNPMGDSKAYQFPLERLIHIRRPGSGRLFPRGALYSLRDSLHLYEDQFNRIAAFYSAGQGALQNVVVLSLTEEVTEERITSLLKSYSDARAGLAPLILAEGMSVSTLNFPAKDVFNAVLYDTISASICNYFGVPVAMATGGGNGEGTAIIANWRGFVRSAIDPIIEAVFQPLSAALLSDKHEFKVDTMQLITGDVAAAAEIRNAATSVGSKQGGRVGTQETEIGDDEG